MFIGKRLAFHFKGREYGGIARTGAFNSRGFVWVWVWEDSAEYLVPVCSIVGGEHDHG